MVSTVVVFKYGDRREGPDLDDGAFTDGPDDRPVSSLPAPLLDAFNSWVRASHSVEDFFVIV